jgi:hypothetical protein
MQKSKSDSVANVEIFIDTNIASKARKSLIPLSVHGAGISSVAVSELLLVYDGTRTAANYYVPVISRRHLMSHLGPLNRDHPFSRHLTDRIVFDFGKDFDPILEFGSKAIAKMVNGKNVGLLRQSVAFLGKNRQRIIRENFDFLVENEVHCVPLTPRIVKSAYQLLWNYQCGGRNLKTSFRNSWNDLLILATAQTSEVRLLTQDSELNRFAASAVGTFSKSESDILDIRPNAVPRIRSKDSTGESKGYINRGWQATFDNSRPSRR